MAKKLYRCLDCNVISEMKKCPVCGETMEKFKAKEKAKAKSDGIRRFPRLLTAESKDQSRVIKLIESKTDDFGCPGQVTEVVSGPVLTEYQFTPDRFTRYKRLKTLHEDLAIALEAESVSVLRIPGKAAVSVSVPRKERKEVTFAETLPNVFKHRSDMEVPVDFGITSRGEPFFEDLATLPHLLIAGSTGAGKSVLVNSILTSLLYIRTPKELKMILVDPKAVELMPYKGLPHLKEDPIIDAYYAFSSMEALEQEMHRRMSFLHVAKVKNLKEFNDKMRAEKRPEDILPRVLFVIDELAELVNREKKIFTKLMTAISSMARAAGIHVIAATQRPSVDILSGKIKVNFPARLGLRVPGTTDSRTIFGRQGCEQLLGRGDMLYSSPNRPSMIRLHSPHCKTEDLNRVKDLGLAFGAENNCPADFLAPDGVTIKKEFQKQFAEWKGKQPKPIQPAQVK